MFARSDLTAAEYTSLNPVIPINEFWLEKDTGYVKRGTGMTWTNTLYWEPGGRVQLGLSGRGPQLYGVAGEYWSYPVARPAVATVDGTLYTYPVYVPHAVVIDRIGAEVTTGAAASTVTLGVYRDNGSGDPGALLFEAGTIDGNSVAAQEITISKKIPGPGLFHFAAMADGGTPTLRFCSAGVSSVMGRQTTLAAALGAGSALKVGRTQTGVVGAALPDPAVTTAVSICPAIAVRLA